MMLAHDSSDFGTLDVFWSIVNGDEMSRRDLDDARAIDDARQAYIREVAGCDVASTSDQIAKLASLPEAGQLDDHEHERAKARVVGGQS